MLRNVEVLIHRGDEVHDGLLGFRIAFESLGSGTLDDGGVVAIVAVFVQEFANIHLDELDEFGISEVHLVEEDHDLRDVHLVGEQHVLTSLGERAVVRSHHENRTINLRSTGNHVLDVVGVARHINVGVVALLGFVLLVRGSDGDTASLLFRSVIDLVVSDSFVDFRWEFLCEDVSDRSRQGSFTVVNVAHRTDVDMWLGTVKICHSFSFDLLLLVRALIITSSNSTYI